MKVLSLFNGISCGRVALERAGIPIERYVSFEIDKYANQVAKANYPHDEYNGDVTTADFTQYKGFDILIGGSPCTHWSIAKQGRETTSCGVGWELFMQYKRALTKSGCRYFLYENNYSIHKDIQAAISEELGVQPIMINSALVSAQQRKRLYWTNIPGIEQPQDKGILLKDILESGAISNKEKAYTLRASAGTKCGISNIIRHIQTNGQFGYQGVFGPITDREKSYCITANEHKGGNIKTYIERGRRQLIFEPAIFNVPHGFNDGGIKYDKSPTLTANGSWQHNNFVVECYDGKTYPIYRVQDGVIGIKEKCYTIKLPDGDYIIRKLTPIECERLQTLPDNYTAAVSNTQRYKGIGNGWTVDVIAHILKYIAINADRKSA